MDQLRHIWQLDKQWDSELSLTLDGSTAREIRLSQWHKAVEKSMNSLSDDFAITTTRATTTSTVGITTSDKTVKEVNQPIHAVLRASICPSRNNEIVFLNILIPVVFVVASYFM